MMSRWKTALVLVIGFAIITYFPTKPWYIHLIPKTTPVFLINGTQYISAEDIQSSIKTESIWDIDISRLEHELCQKFQQIKSVTLERYFPNLLYIRIKEHTFIGKRKDQLLTTDGKWISNQNILSLSNLPEVIGKIDHIDAVTLTALLEVLTGELAPQIITHKQYGGWIFEIGDLCLDISEEVPMQDLETFLKWESKPSRSVVVRSPVVYF